MSNNHKRNLIFLYDAVLILILLVLDQFTKYLAVTHLKDQDDYIFLPGFIRFSYLENDGAAWGMLSGQIVWFIIVTVVLLAGVFFLMVRLNAMRKKNSERKIFLFLQTDLAILIAGALGNLIDRVHNGYVIDFIKTDFIDFPVFNVADCYVTVSCILLFIFFLFGIKEEELDELLKIKKKKRIGNKHAVKNIFGRK